GYSTAPPVSQPWGGGAAGGVGGTWGCWEGGGPRDWMWVVEGAGGGGGVAGRGPARPGGAGGAHVALPAQVFQIPAQSDIGRGDGPGMYGSGIALGIDGFRLGFFGGPGMIAPNQAGAKLEAVWVNLSNGRSGTELLIEHNDVPVDTTIRSRAFDPGPGMIVAAVYGTLWHRWSVPVSEAHPDGFQYLRGTINFPSLGALYN
ncbi:hypothetical protein, partial [Nocardia farcinica]|uniref:hypothetical protein n=1 Tax=Nocardia farcinica TaxID=37329 RepID=UPI0024576134